MKTGSALFLLIGPERWLRHDAIRRLKSQFLAPGFEEMDGVRFSELPMDGRLVLEALKTVPFGSLGRLVILEGFDSLEPEDLPWLEEYLKFPNPTSGLILCTDRLGKEMDRFFAGQPEGLIERILCQPLKGRQLTEWLAAQAGMTGKVAAPETLNLLLGRVGGNLESLSLALETLSLLAGSNREITPAQVEALIQPSVRETAFDILDSAAAGEPQKAIGLLRQTLGSGTLTIEQFMGALGWYYRMVWKTKKDSGSGQEGFSWISPRRQAALQRLRRWPDSKLEKALDDVLEADAGLKLGSPAPEALADRLLLDLGS